MYRSETSRRRRDAYTFIELLCVIAIIGILVALLLPAVQAAREAARRCSCNNNLIQLAIGFAQYEMAHGVYPPGTVDRVRPLHTQPSGYHHNWIMQILPYLEQKNTYNHIDRTVGVYHANNAPVRRLDLSVLRCPSAWTPGKAYSDYAAVHHHLEAPIDVDNRGCFYLNSAVRFDQVLDGSSQTLFLGEKHTIAGDLGWMSGTRATLRNTGTPINYDPNRLRNDFVPRGYPPGVEDTATTALPEDEAVLRVLFGDPGLEPQFFEVLPTDDGTRGWYSWRSVPDNDLLQYDGLEWSYRRPTQASLAVGGFGSRHPGGAQFVRGDGGTTYVSETIDSRVLARLGHRADRALNHWND